MYENILKEAYPNNRFVNRYLKFIKSRPVRVKKFNMPRHHILPRSSFPEYVNLKEFKWNGIVMTNKEHYIAHLMLYNIDPANHGFAYSFYMMSNLTKKKGSRQYAEAREYVAKRSAERNSGPRQLSEEERKEIGKRFEGKYTVYDIRDPNKKTFFICKDNISEFYVHHRTGSKHSDDTKMKISSNSTKGRKLYTNISTGEMKFFKTNESLPPGWKVGSNNKNRRKEYLEGTEWWHDPISGKNVRLSADDPRTGELVKGRKNFNNAGFAAANKMINVVDLKNRKCTKINPNEKEYFHAPQSGTSSEKTFIYVIENKIITNYNAFCAYAKSKGIFVNKDLGVIKSGNISRVSVDTKQFLHDNWGKSYKSLGIYKIPLLEFNIEDYKECQII